VQFQGEAIDRNSQGLHELLAEHFSWVNRGTRDVPAAFRPQDIHICDPSVLVVVDNFHLVSAITLPSETDAPLIVDTNAMHTGPIAL
jgi:hypothetical protein